uniref:F-BAR domain-containing protein n=1 Tax=Plectus sambesii TaxID=2011161 RepID=A0A914VW21_9BILA
MGVDYADYFWGEKHLGYHALYQNMKNGHDAVQELAQFVKERASLEDEHGKLFGKSLTRINSFTNSGSFSSAWTITRNTLELMNDIQGTLVKNLQELHKEVNKYGDDLQKSRRRVKEQDTFDAVNLMQTTTTCLQKAKETYVSRSLELEKLKKENTAPKEIGKAENKLNKAREEYKQYIEKYSKVRDDFEEKMVKSARAFQAQDHAHVSSMRKLLASFARHIEESHAAAAQVSSQFRETVENLAIDDILLQFAEEKGTGRERPDFAIFEEVDVSSMHTPAATTPHTPPSLTNHDSSPIMTSLPTLSIGSSTHMTPYDDLIGLDILGGESSSLAANVPHQQQSQASPAASDTSSSTATATQPATISHSTSRQKLSLWLPGRKKNASNSSIVDTNSPTVQDSSLVSSANSEGGSGGGGFLRKRNKKPSKKGSKETTTPSTAELPPLNILEDGRSSASSKSDERMPHNSAGTGAGVGGVDEEGFSIRPPDDPTKPRWSDSSDSSDDEAVQRSKLKQIQIKPLDQSTSNLNASVDELRDAVGQMTIGRSALGKSRTFDKDPWTATAGPTRSGMTAPMRPALTGDDHLNRTYAGGEYSSAKTLMPMQPSLTGSMSRARPRSNTPTTMFSILGAPGQLALGRR